MYFCPFHDDKYWHFMKTKRPEEFADAVELDKEIRDISRKIILKIILIKVVNL